MPYFGAFLVSIMTIGLVEAFVPRVSDLLRPQTMVNGQFTLHAWGVQKLGQAVINRNSTSQAITADENGVLKFHRSSVGSGADERYWPLPTSANDENEEEFAKLSQIEIGFERLDLLNNLKGCGIPLACKVNMVGMSSSKDLLPNSISGSGVMHAPKLLCTGLLKDWYMDM